MRSLKTAVASLMAVALFTACSEDQSTFNIENVPGRCTLQGKIVYNQGTTYENGKFIYEYKPLASTEVTVTLDNSSFGQYQGTSTFTTTTDEQGYYTIEVPTPAREITATVTTPDFLTVRKVVKMINNKIETVEEEVVIRGNHTFQNIHSNGIVLASFECLTCNKDNNFTGYSEYTTLSGTIGQNAEYIVDAEAVSDENRHLLYYNSAQRYTVFTPVNSANLIVTVDYPDGAHFAYNTTTDRNGNFNLEIPVEGFPASFDYSVEVMPYDGTFVHYERVERTAMNYYGEEVTYYDYEAHTLQGYYSKRFGADFGAYLPVSSERAKCEAKVMVFSPLDNGQNTFGYNIYDFSSSDMWLDELKAKLEEDAKKDK